MASLDAYITELTFIKDNLPSMVVDIGVKHSQEIIQKQNDRLFNSGLDAKNSSIGVYSEYTKKIKDKAGQPTDHVTLKDSGTWYDDMYIHGNDMLEIDNRDASLTGELINGGGEFKNPAYGKDIVGLTEKETLDVATKIIEPDIQKILDKLPNID